MNGPAEAVVQNRPPIISRQAWRLRPVVILLVALLFIAIGGSFWNAAGAANQAAQIHAERISHAAATAVQVGLLEALQATLALEALVQEHQHWDAVSLRFPAVAEELLRQLQPRRVQALLLSPQAVPRAAFPAEGAAAQLLDSGGRGLRPGGAQQTLKLTSINSSTLFLRPPVRASHHPGAVWLVGARPVFVPAAGPNAHFGHPPGAGSLADAWYNSTSKTEFWGLTEAAVLLDVPWDPPPRDGGSGSSSRAGAAPLLRFRVTAAEASGGCPLGISAACEPTVVVQSDPPPRFPLTVHMTLLNQMWTIEVSHGSWDVDWKASALVAAVLLSMLLGMLQLAPPSSQRLAGHRSMELLAAPDPLAEMHYSPMVPSSPIDIGATISDAEALAYGESNFDSFDHTRGSPADTLVSMIQHIVEGQLPDLQDTLMVRACVLHGFDLYKPYDLTREINAAFMDTDVRTSLLSTLGMTTPSAALPWENIVQFASSQRSDSCSGDYLNCLAEGDFLRLEDAIMTIVALEPDTCSSPPTFDRLAAIRSSSSFSSSRARLADTPGLPLFDEVERALMSCESLAFDAFQLSTATNGHPLSALGYFLVVKAGLLGHFNLKGIMLARFLCAIEEGYSDNNPYHNRVHAADVLQSMHIILTRAGMLPGYADPLAHLACLIAAVVHDFRHVGVTNDYLVLTEHELAIRYSDRSPLENYHLAEAFAVKRQHNFLGGLAKDERDRFRRMVIELVLATDMKQHFPILKKFDAMHPVPAESKKREEEATKSVDWSELGPPSPGSPCSAASVACMDAKEQLLALQMAIKCADLGHLCAPLPVHLQWVAALEEELFRQGDQEKAFGLPISPLFDRTKPGVSKSQVGFMDWVAIPQWQVFVRRFPGLKGLVRQMRCNYIYWEQKEQKEQKEAGGVQPQA